ncbi:MAG: hypothetical protein ACI4ED_08425 [Suilimivivens sp.]
MAKKTTPEVNEEQKVQTKYDRKMAARKAMEAKDKRDEKIFKIVSSVVGLVLVLAIVIGVGSSIIRKQSALHGTYIQVGDRNVSQLEFDYYYNAVVNNYISSYGSLLPYMGLDTSQDFADQIYDEENNLSWKDMFDQMAVQQMTQVFALIADAKANDFEYDDTQEYEERVSSFSEAATSAGGTEAEYYKNAFGQYATKSNVASFIKEGMLASAYYNHLTENNAPSAEEIESYYQENPQNYDKVDYRSFVFTADVAEDASEDDINKAMSELKEKADAFKDARVSGSDFEELCVENASEDDKANYEDAETEYCLSEGMYRSYTPSAISSWLYDDARKESDIEVIEDTDNHRYYVVEFVSRYYDAEESDAEISDILASDKTTEYISGLMENYQVTDTKGKLNYLKVEAAAEDTESTDETESTENTENAQ